MSLKDEIRDLRMDPPAGWDETLNERTEDVKECPFCDGKGYDECISGCCGATRDPDLGLCHECHDHCDPSTCPECDGTGIIK